MSQCVVLSVSSDVITFHRRGRKRPIKEEREIREGKAKNKKGGTGKWERVEKPQTTRSR